MPLHLGDAPSSRFWSQFPSVRTDANAWSTINNSQSEAFSLFCSIRQGFHLAPTLYVLVAEGFGYLLAHFVSLGLVHGIPYLNHPPN